MKEGFRGEQGEGLEQENERLKADIAFFQKSLKIAEILNEHQSKRIALLEKDATTDALTGIKNRRGFEQAIKERNPELEKNVGIILVDLNKFKPINDDLGHAAGNAVLQETARHLESLVRSTDEVARIGGDEFVIMCYGGEEEGLMVKFGNGLEFEAPYEGKTLSITASTGVAVKLPGETIEDTVKRADERMYEFKRARGDAR